MILAVLCLLGMLIWVWLQGRDLRSQRHELGVQQVSVRNEQQAIAQEASGLGSAYLSLVEGCVRLQIQRVALNRTADALYLLVKAVEGFTKQSDPFLGTLRRAESKLSWTPLTNCRSAVNHRGVRYRAPEAVAFDRRLPFAAALDLVRARSPG